MPLPTIATDRPEAASAAPDDATSSAIDGLPGRFTLHYQPELDLATDRIVACEALLRWWHPEYGLLHPGAALHKTRWEATLAAVESWSFRVALGQARRWADDGRPLPVAVNVSRRQIKEPDLAERIAAALDETGLAPDLLAVDVPLSAFTKAPVPTARAAAALRELGVAVVVDGIGGDRWRTAIEGTRPSAMKIPLYLANRRQRGVHPSVGLAVALAEDLGAATVAKAVETEEQLAVVRELGFDRAFGHLIGPAVPADQVPTASALPRA